LIGAYILFTAYMCTAHSSIFYQSLLMYYAVNRMKQLPKE